MCNDHGEARGRVVGRRYFVRTGNLGAALMGPRALISITMAPMLDNRPVALYTLLCSVITIPPSEAAPRPLDSLFRGQKTRVPQSIVLP
ncbi:hypothetical protein L211DRAFT_493281 [Terfezia boudieri ATCC MYA-4762]|uniref:Uncharacterized protein n=1 Tax=Terfezia boudieri ATCC MYA-4762 TaxID=1051890 RepID=A0A3N4LH29_9PEZI|nr:hypothetical protein L211DRAFT_493281 [Terfezia boudieri ATCC MYA-4762]